ncbi:MAG: hypothetical protein CVU48_03245 [Candidatus Cloacimonetes bacterium HGW-Cloacimonetes-1]|nr:MAG: hypothetical protein CVU48_03245 [Candidatus Cloacimonetes bacterium HGW-Cloacimonetes-1]
MKKTLTLILMLGFALSMFAQASDLFISEYVEGSSNNKAIEIFNGTGAAVDLSQYSLKLGSNGGEWSATNSITLSGTLANNDVYVIANASANATILGLSDLTSTVTYYNGDDCLGLFHGTTMIDIIGVYQVDPGTAWDVAGVVGATLNHTLIRKPQITSGTTNWATSAGTTIDDSQWIVQPIDYITDLGMHYFNPNAGQSAATPTFTPPAGAYATAQNVVLASTTPGSTIRYTLNGSNPTSTSTLYTAPINVTANTTIKAVAFAAGLDPSYIATAEYVFPVMVPNIATLRAQNADNSTIYMVTNQVVMTFQQNWRHQKYFQDTTAGILVDDYSSAILSIYAPMDGVTGIIGKLSRYSTGMLQFIPVADPGAATAHNVPLVIPTLTVSQINANLEMYQSMLVRVNAAHFNETGAFAGLTGYTVTDATGTIAFRTSYTDVDYVVNTSPIPTGNIPMKVIVNQFTGNIAQVTARSLADFNPPVPNDDNINTPFVAGLIGNYPNPFNPTTTIQFSTAKSEPVQINIYNQKGQLVKGFDLISNGKGIHEVVWNGQDNSGKEVSSGIYYYRMKSGKYTNTKKMILMK